MRDKEQAGKWTRILFTALAPVIRQLASDTRYPWQTEQHAAEEAVKGQEIQVCKR